MRGCGDAGAIMTHRNDELQRRSFDQLMRAAGDRLDARALKAYKEFVKIKDAGGRPEIYYSNFHGWVIKDLLA